jgi:hypothetical protein
MSTDLKTPTLETPTEQRAEAHFDSQGSTPVRRIMLEAFGLAVAVVAAVVTYALFIAHPGPHTPLNDFLATFAHGNAAIWPMQLVWYAAAVAMVGLALWPIRRSSQLICLLAAVYCVWIGIAYFAVLFSGTAVAWVSGLWAAAFILEGILLLVSGVVRRDLVIRPRSDLTTAVGGVFIGYALIGYPLLGMLGGHPLSTLPVFGLSPCATVIFYFGLLMWARPPVPLYLLLVPLAWALSAAPGAMATGVVPDFALVPAGVITAVVILWRDRISTWQTVVAGLLLALMIAWSGHDDVQVMTALVLVAVTLALTVIGDRQRLRARARRRTHYRIGSRIHRVSPASGTGYPTTGRAGGEHAGGADRERCRGLPQKDGG